MRRPIVRPLALALLALVGVVAGRPLAAQMPEATQAALKQIFASRFYAAERFGLVLETDWNPTGGIPADVHGVVTTYQQVGSSPIPFRYGCS